MLGSLLCALLAAAPAALTNEDCLGCHSDKDLRSAAGASLFVDAERYGKSVHSGFSCVDCHTGIGELPHAEKLPQVACASCHEDTAKEYARSVHGRAKSNGLGDSATCRSCHGSAHGVLPASDPASLVSKHSLPATCGACHADPEFLARHKIPFARPVEAYKLSVHGRAVERGETKAASCSDCHGSHGIQPSRDAASRINHWKLASTCGKCHAEIQAAYAESVHGKAAAAGVKDAPVCTDCHGEHQILAPAEPGSLVNATRVSSVTCGHCHSNERLAERYNLPQDKVPSYRDSFHGLAQRGGSQTVANCASCHGVHNILASTDTRSTIHPQNLAKTCGACHPGAGTRFTIGAVHVETATDDHPAVRLVRVAYYLLIPLTLGFMLLHNGLDFVTKMARGIRRHDSGERVTRMNLKFRIAHWLTIASFLTLIVTGFALKFPDAWWSAPLLLFEEHFAFRGWAHRVAGVVLIAGFAYHLLHLALVPRDRVILRELLPVKKDAADLVGMFRYFLSRKAPRPTFGMFGYAEKMEYWAFVWGTFVMAATGFLLWFETWSLANLPKWASDAATAVHWYEAILATASIAIWHWYAVIFDPEVYPMDTAWLTGKCSADHLKHTRPEYYLSIVRARQQREAEKSLAAGAAPGEADASGGKKTPSEPS